MQPSNGGLSYIHHHQQHLKQQEERQQHLMEDDCCCSPSVLQNLQNLNHPCLPHLQQEQHKHPHQVFLRQHHQLFYPFQQQQQQQQSQGQGTPQNPSLFTMSFKLGRNEGSGNKMASVLNNQDEAAATPTLLDGNGHINPPHAILMPRSWHPPEDYTSIKEPFWKQLVKNRWGSEEEEISGNRTRYFRPLEIEHVVDESRERCRNLDIKFPIFNELEAIYSLAKIAEANQTGSGSVLTGDHSPTNAGLSVPSSATNRQNVGANGAANNVTGVDHGSENSIGEEASLRKSQKRKRKRKLKEKLSYMAGFFENTVKKVMDHQEMLHRKFLEVIERMDRERTDREETWRHQEAEKHNREAISRAHEWASTSSREAQIVSYIVKITGQSINLPIRMAPPLLQPEISNEPIKEITSTKSDSHSRWPKDEVEALIKVRSRVEIKFQEPGVKGPLWEEVSSLMSSMGYQRSAKRCKEKWENINKYFRKAKESPERRSQRSKTCSYFNQLDQLYSRSLINYPSNTTYMPSRGIEFDIEKQGHSEVSEAFAVGKDDLAAITNLPGENIKGAEMGSSRFEFDGIADKNEELEEGSSEQDKEVYKDDEQENGEQGKDDGSGDEENEN